MTLTGYPFVAVVGHRPVKQALLLLAIEPELRGALIASQGGSDERTLTRALRTLLPDSDRNRDGTQVDPFSAFDADGGVVELPLNITEDRLLGGVDLERTITTGEREISKGLLARANGRVLHVSDFNLLESSTVAHLAQALDTRYVHVEREGLSALHDADFLLVGTFDRDEGEPSPMLCDRVGLFVDSVVESSADEKAEIIARAFRFDKNPITFADDFAIETAQLKIAVEEARARLPRVRLSRERRRQLSQIAMRLEVEGNRADVFAVKAARANAALAGRNEVIDEDVVVAIQLVLAPRATKLPAPRDQSEEQNVSPEQQNPEEHTSSEIEDGDRDAVSVAMQDVIIQAMDARVPEDLFSIARRSHQPSRSGKRHDVTTSKRGRYVRSRINRTGDVRIAIGATLRAAAPFQLFRREQSALTRWDSADGQSTGKSTSMTTSARVRIEPSDLRFKEFKHRSGILFIFAVDASGSMALNRMAQAKGAITRLLQQAYLHRDKVALVSFRGEKSDVLLEPTRSVEQAKQLVDALPAGGGTPLSAGLVKAIELVRLARLRGTSQAMLVLFTDGRANVGLGSGHTSGTTAMIRDEIGQLGALLESEEIRSVVIDTKSRFVSSGDGEALARNLGARYFYLPRFDAGAVYDAITSITGRPSDS